MLMKFLNSFWSYTSTLAFFFSASSSTISSNSKSFEVYWNVPTFMCHKHGLNFMEVSRNFGIIQNSKDEFRGENVAILYDPGMFPALLKNTNGTIDIRNGGIPQEGNLHEHLNLFKSHLNEQIQPEFSGIGIIDFESWRPIFRQNWASLAQYRDKSVENEQKKHPFLPKSTVMRLAIKNFEEAGKEFMETTLELAKKLRPKAQWSYYAYPYCYNLSPNQPSIHCNSKLEEDNDRISWLWKLEDILMPSVYLFKAHSPEQRVGMIAGRVDEAQRIADRYNPSARILPYWWFKYHDRRDSFLTKADVLNGFNDMVNRQVNGIIIWGSSNDVNSKEKCHKFHDYLMKILGPAVIEVKKSISNHHRNQNESFGDNIVANIDDYEYENNEDDSLDLSVTYT